MRRFKTILFVFEDVVASDSALERAADLAIGNGATLTLARCVGEPSDGGILDLAGGGNSPGWEQVEAGATADLEEVAEVLRPRGLQVRTELLVGIPFREVIQFVQRNGHDLVMKTAAAPGGTRARLFGSTDLHLIRKCPAPVWIDKVRADGERYGRVMAAVDVGDTSEAGRAMTRLILDLATSIAAHDEGDVHVVHAWSTPGERMARGPRRGLAPAPAEVAHELEQEAERRQALFQEAVAPYLAGPVAPQLHLVQGDAEEVLPLFAMDRAVDLIVMGTLARTGIPGFFMGNTAEDVLQQVDCSVVTLKPEGFVSPVR